MKENKIRKVFLENLPRKKNNNSLINWFECKSHKVKFIYYDKEGWVEIVEVKRENSLTILGLKYLNKDIFYIWTGNFQNCQLGELLGINTRKHYYNVGDIIEVSTGKIKIKEQSRNKNDNTKEYIFECLECGWENGRINEGNLKKKQGCGCCSNKVPVLGINTIADTDPWMVKFFKNTKDAESRTFGSQDKGLLHCPICKVPRDNMAISTLYREKDICCQVCSDGFSYGEKFTYNLLKQLNLQIKRHKHFDWSKNVLSEIESLCGNKEYDFYIEHNNIVIETNGLQHYEECSFSRRSYYEESENDKLKEKLALSNNIKEENYIVIDCRYSKFEYIKNNILNNEKINKLFDISKINWNLCEQESLSSYLVKACEYYNQGVGHMEIAKIMDIDFKTVKRYLKRAREYNLCNYISAVEIHDKNVINAIELWNNGIHNASEIGRLLNLDNTVIGDYLKQAEDEGLIEYKKFIRDSSKKSIINIEYNKEFTSINECYTNSEKEFGIKLYRKGITHACNTGQEYKGLHFQYDNRSIHI
jgi:hypothetical protein